MILSSEMIFMLENYDICSKMTSPLMLSGNLQLIVGHREYIYSHHELFLSQAPVSVYGIKGPIEKLIALLKESRVRIV